MMRMIVAMDRRNGMANESGIPWTLPTDQKFFFDQTSAGPILMGHTTYTEIDAPLHGRTNFVATRGDAPLRDGFVPVNDLDAFLAAHDDDRVNNIGGASLFAAMLPQADELVITRIDAEFACTKFFPEFLRSFERATCSEPLHENGLSFTFQTWYPALAP